MNFNEHYAVEGKHAFLSPSNYSWLNYDEERLKKRWLLSTASKRGTDLHALAHTAINLGIKLSTANPTMSMYVADAIGYKMKTEQTLFYSENCFGTADTISFRRNVLRIHDLKTGELKTSEKQLEIYAALFCLEYQYSPWDISIELRIYQSGQVRVYKPEPDVIFTIMNRIVEFNDKIEMFKEDD